MVRLKEGKDSELFKKIHREVAYMRISTTIFFSIAYLLLARDSRYFYLPLPFAVAFVISQVIGNRHFNSPCITTISTFLLNITVVANTDLQRSPFIFLFLIPVITQGIESNLSWVVRSSLLNTIFLSALGIYAFIQRDSFGLAYISGIILLMYWFSRIVVKNQESLLNYAISMEKMAHVDPLTGLYNRRALEKYSSVLIANRTPFTLIMCDLDGFKRYNDIYGHQAGDDVLRKFAELLRESLRSTDLSFRYGGDEFVILVQGDPKGIGSLCNRIREKLKSRIDGVDISFGYALFPRDGTSMNKILATADNALYKAKRMNYSAQGT